MSDMVGDLHWMAAKAVEDLTKKDGEIAKRDARIVELELEVALRDQAQDRHVEYGKELRAELAATKAQGVVMPTVDQAMRVVLREMGSSKHIRGTSNWCADVGRAVLDEVARLNAAPVQQVSVPDGFCIGAWRDALEKIAKYAPQVNCAARTELERAGLIAVHALIAFSAPQFRHARGTQTASNAAPAAPAADVWIAVGERLPESERTVLAFYLNSHGKGRRVRAEYIAPKSKGADDGWDCDCPADYDEVTDQNYWPAGWYEVIDNWDELTHMVINEGEVTHWMPLPASPAGHRAAQGVNP